MAGAQAQPQPLDVASTSITDKLTLTYKLKPNSSTDYAWFYKVGTNGTETEFSGTLTGTNANWQQGAINIKSEKAIADANNLDSYPCLLYTSSRSLRRFSSCWVARRLSSR